MLLSMTGYGQARGHSEGCEIHVELRSVNNRYLKLSTRTPDAYGPLEPRIEQTVRRYVNRGTVQANIRVARQRRADEFRLNTVALESYRQQLLAWQQDQGIAEPIPLQSLLDLPGVAETERDKATDLETEWPMVEAVLVEALEQLVAMRRHEGEAMATDLIQQLNTMSGQLDGIRQRAPGVTDDYRNRLAERVGQWLARHDIALEAADLIRETALFADRADIAEEVVRLSSHIDHMHSLIANTESNGRKLDFLTQEMFRETNTIGSKSNDLEIAQRVMTLKTAIERIREMVQNVE